jgi:hypothetical protein
MADAKFNPLTELDEALAMLTRDHELVVQLKGVVLGSRIEAPLLLKLRNAVASSIGDGSGGGKSNKASVPLNVGARDLYDRIAGDIRSWFDQLADQPARAAHGRPTPEVTLTQWYIRYVSRFNSNLVTEKQLLARARLMRDWTQQIRDLIDPPYRWPLTTACPICGLEWASLRRVDDPNEIERVRVLNAVERENIEDSYVVCLNPECGRIWRGKAGARELKIAMDDVEAAKESDDTIS